MTAALTPNIAAALTALDAADGKTMKLDALRKASGCTFRGFYIIFSRMLAANFIAQDEARITITFGGLSALRRAGKRAA